MTGRPVPDEHDLIIPVSDLTGPGDLYAALMGGLVVDLHPEPEPCQHRSWRRWRPTNWLLDAAFAARVIHGYRYDNTGDHRNCLDGVHWT